MKAIYKYDLNGNFIESYDSIKEASIKNNISKERMYLSVFIKRRIGDFIYVTNKDYKGTVYKHKKGTNPIVYESGFSVAQAVKIVGKSKWTIYKLLKEGTLKGKVVGRSWCIEEESVYNYIKRK